jgi:hypothetical protein
LFDSDAKNKDRRPFKSLSCYDFNGNLLWDAELLDRMPYFHIEKLQGNILTTYTYSYDCRIDIKTGKIINTIFTK